MFIDLETNRVLTKTFIDALPVTLSLRPRARTRTASGAFEWYESPTRLPQIFTLIEPSGDPLPTITQDGVVRTIEFELLGEWDAKLARFDVFTHQGREWEIIELFFDNGYERRAMVSARG